MLTQFRIDLYFLKYVFYFQGQITVCKKHHRTLVTPGFATLSKAILVLEAT